ncbi:NAD-P-binding protein [Panus rudis PR-1116 ss-1]|nr:NAD-P-binding protein [Panus rudis PR-1116 ss-1]
MLSSRELLSKLRLSHTTVLRGTYHNFSTSSVLRLNRAIVYESFGDPTSILSATTYPDLPPPPSNSLNVKFTLSPINPADLNVIENKYHSKPSPVESLVEGRHKFEKPHYVGGNEGLAVITDVGTRVSGYKPGDRVVVTKPQAGTWASARTLKAEDVLKVPAALSDVNAATITVNPPTAYNMLHGVVDLKPGEFVMQNGANSAVGQTVIQIAARKGIQTLNFIRDRPDLDATKEYLQSLGATHVFTYEDLKNKERVKEIESLVPKGTRLMLNCVSGEATKDMARFLSQKATVVSYGAMSMQPLIMPTGLFIFGELICRGFWQSKWYADHTKEEREKLMQTLSDFKLREPEHEILTLESLDSDDVVGSKVRSVISKMRQGRYGKKVLLKFEEPRA